MKMPVIRPCPASVLIEEQESVKLALTQLVCMHLRMILKARLKASRAKVQGGQEG